MPKPAPYDLADVERRRAAGESWAEIGRAHGRTAASARTWHQRKTESVASEAAVSDRDPADPFAEAARPVEVESVANDESPSSSSSSTVAEEGTPLGHDAARAYLPLLYATMDGCAAAAAAWVLRRRLGARATSDLIAQARQLSALTEAEKTGLEAVLVAKLAEVRLTPNEALVLTLAGIYSAKMMSIMSLESDGPVVIVAPAEAEAAGA